LVRTFRVSPLHPSGPVEAAGYWICRGTFRLALRTAWHLSLADVRDLPDGPVILAANHRSFIDPLVLGSAVERRVTFMMTARYYDLPALNWFFRMSRCIVVDDEKPDNRKALRDSLESLDAGQVVAIFPEGHISPDGALRAAQPGMGWLARARCWPRASGDCALRTSRSGWARRASPRTSAPAATPAPR
jgi:1-acyl-sn-glycerol-3-phosphate acyltransferase